MTTIAVRNNTMACDSFVTNGYTAAAIKIRKHKGVVVGYCGDWIAGEHFSDFYLKGEGQPERQGDDDIELLVLKPSGIYLVDDRFREVKIRCKYYAVGSGGMAAMVAMNMGATAIEAIREAIKVDDYTNGRIRSLSI